MKKKKKFLKKKFKNFNKVSSDYNALSLHLNLLPFFKKTSYLLDIKIKICKYISYCNDIFIFTKYWRRILSLLSYLELSFKTYNFISQLNRDYNFKYIRISDTRYQSFTDISNKYNKTLVNYSIGLILCTVGLKKNKLFKSIKKTKKGFLKYLNFVKHFIIPKYFLNTTNKINRVGILIKGLNKKTPIYSNIQNYLIKFSTKISFLLFLPKVKFSFMKIRKYARLKRNLRKKIVKSISLV